MGAIRANPPAAHRPPRFLLAENPASTEDRDQLVTGLRTLAGIPLIKELYVGILADTEKRDVVDASWQVSELMFFNDLECTGILPAASFHLEFVKNYSHLWEKVIVYDTMNLFSR